MPDWPRFLALFGGIIMITVIGLALRWTWGTGRDQPGLRVPDPDDRTGDGLLAEVSRVPTESAAQVLRARLGGAGIRATIGRVDGADALLPAEAQKGGAYRLLVFRTDLVPARIVLSRGALE